MLRFFIFCLLILQNQQLLSWEYHYLLTYESLKEMPGLDQETTIEAETLDSFVEKEQTGLISVLKQTEALSKRSLMHYPPLPEQLFFKADKNNKHSLTKQFLMSLRLNPDIAYPLFVLQKPLGSKNNYRAFSKDEIKEAPLSTLATIESGQALRKIMPREKLSALEIIASATEEPDHGMDFNLFEDNKSWYGAIYNFGKQPFGNPQLSFGTQAPFHMGFYHEPKILYMAGEFIKHCYPELRINQFMALSRFAFATKHPYWGYRFLGLAQHYLQDLTQIYHARLAPGSNTVKLLGINLMAMAGIKRPKEETIQILSNKHLGLENYQLGSMQHALMNTFESPLLTALKDQSNDLSYGSFSDSYARMVIAKEAYDASSKIDDLVLAALPKRFLDPSFNFDGNGQHTNLFIELNKMPTNNKTKLDQALFSMMRSFGAHTRQSLRFIKAL